MATGEDSLCTPVSTKSSVSESLGELPETAVAVAAAAAAVFFAVKPALPSSFKNEANDAAAFGVSSLAPTRPVNPANSAEMPVAVPAAVGVPSELKRSMVN